MNCDHVWIVYSTAMIPPTIMVECAECGALGGVLEHTQEEWGLAYHAPSMPFRWADDSRVILQDDLPEPSPDDFRRLDEFLDGAHVVASSEGATLYKLNDTAAGFADYIDELECPHRWNVARVDPAAGGQLLALRCAVCNLAAQFYLYPAECADINRRMDDYAARNPGRDPDEAMGVMDALVYNMVNSFLLKSRIWIETEETPPVGDLINSLHLFQDDDDIPF